MTKKKAKAKKFVKIHEVNDWGVKGFYLKAPDGVTHSHRDMDQAYRIKHDEVFEVQFPDKSVVKAVANVVHTINWVSDHGQDYSVDSEELKLVFLTPLYFRGIEFKWWGNFNNVKVRRM